MPRREALVQLREALDQTATGALRRVALAHGLAPDEATTRSELVERLLERLTDTAYLAEQVSGLAADERAALQALHTAGGQTRGFLLEKRHAGALPKLVARGFLFRTFTAAGPRRGEVFAAPDEVLSLLPGPPEAERPPTAPPTTEAPAERRTTDPAFNLFTVASFVLRQQGGRARNTAAFANEVGWVEEPGGWDWQERWAFLRHVGQTAGLLARRPDGEVTISPSLPDMLSDPPALREHLWRAYLRTREWSELARACANVPHGQTLAEQVDASVLRGAILDALAGLGDGMWVSLEALAEWMRHTRPAFLREQLDARSAALRDPTTDQPLLDQPAAWSRVETPLLRYTLLGPLYWLGSVASSPDGRRLALTHAGASLLRSGTAEILARPFEPCSWSSDAGFSAPPRTDLGALLHVERYLALRERGRPSRYAFDRERVADALAAGGTIGECRGLLERLTQGRLPQRVAADLDTWSERFGALSLRPAVVLEARSEADLEAALDLRPVRALMKRRLGATAAEVAASDALEVAAALRSAGHLPKVDASLWLMAGRRAYAGLVDEQVLEFLLVSLLAFQAARPERLADLEGASSLIERLEGLFPGDRLASLREAAHRLAGELKQTSPRRMGPTRRAKLRK
jgi:hypothetical protein